MTVTVFPGCTVPSQLSPTRDAYVDASDCPAGVSQKVTEVDVAAPLPTFATDSCAITVVPGVIDDGFSLKLLTARLV